MSDPFLLSAQFTRNDKVLICYIDYIISKGVSMATVTFDTLKFVERLKAGGVPRNKQKQRRKPLFLPFLKQWICN